jgi:hypothetical protein
MEFTLLGLEALETVVRFLFIIADDERKVVKVRKSGKRLQNMPC